MAITQMWTNSYSHMANAHALRAGMRDPAADIDSDTDSAAGNGAFALSSLRCAPLASRGPRL